MSLAKFAEIVDDAARAAKAIPQFSTQAPLGVEEAYAIQALSIERRFARGETFHFCSDGCKDIFEAEPEKYVQAWLPPHQIFQGHCGGATMADVLKYYGITDGVENGEYVGSPDDKIWSAWMAEKATIKAAV